MSITAWNKRFTNNVGRARMSYEVEDNSHGPGERSVGGRVGAVRPRTSALGPPLGQLNASQPAPRDGHVFINSCYKP